jgi:hypothetical protein
MERTLFRKPWLNRLTLGERLQRRYFSSLPSPDHRGQFVFALTKTNQPQDPTSKSQWKVSATGRGRLVFDTERTV